MQYDVSDYHCYDFAKAGWGFAMWAAAGLILAAVTAPASAGLSRTAASLPLVLGLRMNSAGFAVYCLSSQQAPQER